jgi:hypothetical protein
MATYKKFCRSGDGRLKTGEEIAIALGENPRTISTLRREGKIPYLKLGWRTIRYDLGKVIAALQRLEVRAVGDRKGAA